MVCGSQALVTAQTNYQRILSFGPLPTAGSSPRGQLLEASDGWLYGTTYSGGASNLGTVFRIAKDGSGFTVLRSLSAGYYPYAGLVEGTDGALYGTASAGGSNKGGTVFKLNKDGGGFLTLHEFDPASTDGGAPIGALCLGADGIFYGTTSGGGAGNMGTVFKINSIGTVFTVLHAFTGLTNGVDGSYPVGGLLQGQDGSLYGTTQTGGSNDFGTAFKLNTDGTGFSLIYQFRSGVGDGHVPSGTLLQTADGMLFGTTAYGGTSDSGAVFRLGTNGSNYALLNSFSGGVDGNQPLAGLALGTNGALYGTTRYGGASNAGVAFVLGTSGNGFAVLRSFLASSGDGGQPIAGLRLASDGAWYGTCYYGGDYLSNNVSGVSFRLSAVAPPVWIRSIDYLSASVLLGFANGTAAQTYRILASPDLSPGSWQEIGTSTAAIDGSFQFRDTSSGSSRARFYRSAVR